MIRDFYEAILNAGIEELKATGSVDSRAFIIDAQGNVLSTHFNVEDTPDGFWSDIERLYKLSDRTQASAMAFIQDTIIDEKTTMLMPESKNKINGVVVIGEDSLGKICLAQGYKKRGDKIFLKGRKVKRITNGRSSG